MSKGKSVFRWLCLGVVSMHGIADWIGVGGASEPRVYNGPRVVTARPAPPPRSSGGGHGAYYGSGYRGGGK